MPAKKFSLPLSADQYDLTAEDKRRFAQEQSLGMVSPRDPLLTRKARPIPIDRIKSAQIQDIIARLVSTADGQQRQNQEDKKRRTLVGLAAPQIGESLRIIVVDTEIKASRKRPGKLECFINPEIVWRSRETEEDREGCFSAGPVWGLVRRSIAVKIRAFDPEGNRVSRIFEGFTARVVQHEYDHLDGIRFADRIKSDKKRHWVHTEELDMYPSLIKRWPRLCSRERWEAFKKG